MGAGPSGLAQRRVEQPAREGTPELSSCPLPCVAGVLGLLLGQELTAAEVAEKAVALGLARQPPAGEEQRLTARALSRLFLAGYRLPAHVQAGTSQGLLEHLQAGRHVFLLLNCRLPDSSLADPQTHELFQAHLNPDGLEVLLTRMGEPSLEPSRLSLDQFPGAWAATGHFLIVALRRWEDLPPEGKVFFGGSRDCTGAYHWHTAECETDAAGHILRF